MIDYVKQGSIEATRQDLIGLSRLVKDGDVEKYFDIQANGFGIYKLSPKKILSENIQFEQNDILDGLEEVKNGNNNVIMCRNFWKYLSPEKIAQTSLKLRKVIDADSRIIIGSFDRQFVYDPFFLSELGIFSADLRGDNRNIMNLRIEDKAKKYLEDPVLWEEFVKANYREYVPCLDEE